MNYGVMNELWVNYGDSLLNSMNYGNYGDRIMGTAYLIPCKLRGSFL